MGELTAELSQANEQIGLLTALTESLKAEKGVRQIKEGEDSEKRRRVETEGDVFRSESPGTGKSRKTFAAPDMSPLLEHVAATEESFGKAADEAFPAAEAAGTEIQKDRDVYLS